MLPPTGTMSLCGGANSSVWSWCDGHSPWWRARIPSAAAGEHDCRKRRWRIRFNGRPFQGMIVYDGPSRRSPVIFMQPDWKGRLRRHARPGARCRLAMTSVADGRHVRQRLWATTKDRSSGIDGRHEGLHTDLPFTDRLWAAAPTRCTPEPTRSV